MSKEARGMDPLEVELKMAEGHGFWELNSDPLKSSKCFECRSATKASLSKFLGPWKTFQRPYHEPDEFPRLSIETHREGNIREYPSMY